MMEIFELNILKSFIIILVIILYWKFVYYKYHKKDITPITLLSCALVSSIIGLYELLIDKQIKFQQISIIYFAILFWLVFHTIFILIGIKRHGLNKDIDITLTFIYNKFGKIFVIFTMIGSFILPFFMVFGTYFLLGREHIILLAMIFLAWIASGLKLFFKKVIK